MFNVNNKVVPLVDDIQNILPRSSVSRNENNINNKNINNNINTNNKDILEEEIINVLTLPFTISNAFNLFIQDELLPFYVETYSLNTESITSKYKSSLPLITKQFKTNMGGRGQRQ